MTMQRATSINVLNDHHCFGCGALNPHGLLLSFYANPDSNGVWAPFLPTDDFEGYGGIIHGGIVCTILDEVMAWSLYRQKIWAVTGQLNTRFRKPMMVGEAVKATGRIYKDRGRVIEMKAEIRRENDDLLIADGTATFFRVPESQEADWNERYLGGRDLETVVEGVKR